MTEPIDRTLRRLSQTSPEPECAQSKVITPWQEQTSYGTSSENRAVSEYELTAAVIDNSLDAVYFKDCQGRYVRLNQAQAARLGLADPALAVGKTDFDFLDPQRAEANARAEREIIESGQSRLNLEVEEQWPEGEATWTSVTRMPLNDRWGRIVGTYSVLKDITEEKRAEAALTESEHRYRTVCELISDYAYSFKVMPDGSFEDEWVTADSFIRLTGYHWDELDALGPFALFHPSERPLLPHEQELLRMGQPMSRDYRIITRCGEERWLHILRRPQWSEDHSRIVRFFGIAQDVTERKRVEAAEHEQRVLAEAMRDIAAALISSTDVRTVMTRVLETVGRVVPHDIAAIALIEGDTARVEFAHGWNAEDEAIIRAVRLPLTTRNLHEMLVNREPMVIPDVTTYAEWADVELRVRTPVGSYVGAPIQVHGQVIGFLNLDSRTPGFFTQQHAERLRVFADQAAIAIENAQLYDEMQQHALQLEERVAERTVALQHAKEHVEAILDNNSDAIIVARQDGSVSQVNPAFGILFRRTPDDAYQHSLSGLLETDSRVTLDEALITVTQLGQTQRLELVIQRQDGSRFDADVALSPIIDHDPYDDRPTRSGIICSVRDITERKQVEAATQQALTAERELNELKSRFISMASHEFRTPLASILSSSELMIRYRQRMEISQMDDKLNNIIDQVRYLTTVIDDVLDLSRMQSTKAVFEPALIDLDALCRHIIQEYVSHLEITQHLDFTCTPSPLLAELDSNLMRRILNNLISNAIKYSLPQETISIAVSGLADDVMLTVSDRGIGIPSADLKHLFEPFHRAKNVGAIPGTGLGLAITKQAVEMHGGVIDVSSQIGFGTTFTIRLPLKSPFARSD